jgi:hypothetical protein
MSTNQLFFAIGGLMVTLFGIFMAFVKYYIDAKVDPIAADVKLLVIYMIDHESRISRLEERTK